MGFKSTVKKYTKKATKAVGKRYGVSQGRKGLRVGKGSIDKVFKDVAEIKSRLNVEKKFVDSAVSFGTCSQINDTFPGYYSTIITPNIPLGVGENKRVGGSIKMTGIHMKLQFLGQKDLAQSRMMKIMLIKSTDTNIGTIVDDLFDDNPLTGFRDYYSNRNYTNNPDAHKIIRTVYCKLDERQIYIPGSSDTFGESRSSNRHKEFGMKMQQITRFEGGANTPKDANYFLVIFVDGGNSSVFLSSNPGVMSPTPNGGIDLQHYYRWWYVDN